MLAHTNAQCMLQQGHFGIIAPDLNGGAGTNLQANPARYGPHAPCQYCFQTGHHMAMDCTNLQRRFFDRRSPCIACCTDLAPADHTNGSACLKLQALYATGPKPSYLQQTDGRQPKMARHNATLGGRGHSHHPWPQPTVAGDQQRPGPPDLLTPTAAVTPLAPGPGTPLRARVGWRAPVAATSTFITPPPVPPAPPAPFWVQHADLPESQSIASCIELQAAHVDGSARRVAHAIERRIRALPDIVIDGTVRYHGYGMDGSTVPVEARTAFCSALAGSHGLVSRSLAESAGWELHADAGHMLGLPYLSHVLLRTPCQPHHPIRYYVVDDGHLPVELYMVVQPSCMLAAVFAMATPPPTLTHDAIDFAHRHDEFGPPASFRRTLMTCATFVGNRHTRAVVRMKLAHDIELDPGPLSPSPGPLPDPAAGGGGQVH